jgi:hypothetical protein
VRQLAAAFFQASLLAVRQMLEQCGREQARWGKAAASCRTPKSLRRSNFQSSEASAITVLKTNNCRFLARLGMTAKGSE